MTDNPQQELDPITYQVAKHKIWQALWEGRYAMELVSGSVVVTEAKEVLCSLFDTEGNTIDSSAGLLGHIVGSEKMIKQTIEWYSVEPGIYDGDVFFWNDPYIGGNHAPDQGCVAPIFYQGKRIGWVAALFHTPEVGAIEPGGMPPTAKTVFHEGLRVPGLKIMEKGKERPDVYKLLERATRDPVGIVLDTKARVAGLNVVKARVLELMAKYGLEAMQAIFEKMIADSEKIAREKLGKLADGAWRTVVCLDHNGTAYELKKICLSLTKKGDKLFLDYTGTDPQSGGPTNCSSVAIYGCVFTTLCMILCWEERFNRGTLNVIEELIAPLGSVVNAEWPAAVSLGPMCPMLMLMAMLDNVFSNMLITNEKYYTDQSASWNNNPLYLLWGGISQHGRTMGTVLFDFLANGQGAGPRWDGVDTGVFHYTPEVIASDLEMYESFMPFLYLSRRQAPDSGGPGKFRGGVGLEIAYMVHKTPGVELVVIGQGSKSPSGTGIYGGSGAGMARVVLAQNTNIQDKIRQRQLPYTLEEIQALEGGEIKDYPPMVPSRPARAGDIVYLYGGGGSGYGDPLDREPLLVLKDVQNELVTLKHAEEVYGVVITPDKEKVNAEATARCRKALKKRREDWANPPAPAAISEDESKRLVRMHEYLEITTNKHIRCIKCGHVFCEAAENYKDYALKAEVSGKDLGEHYAPDPAFVVYHEFYCPGCKTLLDQDVLPPGHPAVWNIQVSV